MLLTTGTRLGPYEVVDLLGVGGMGEVYRGRDTRLDRTVAIKILPGHLAALGNHRARFEREALAISALSHQRICTLFDVGEHNGVPFLVMEHLVGETLASHLRKGPLPIQRAIQVGIEIAEGLSAAHKQGIVHRDLKPSNVMLTKSGVKLLDFGIARIVETDHGSPRSASETTAGPLTSEGVVLGTRPYMAPEQLEGKATDARTDLWALGTILYEMLTGRRAFAGETSASLTAAILQLEPEPLSSVRPDTPPALERLVSRCLAKDPEARWDTAHDVADELAWVGQTSGSGPVQDNQHGRRRHDRWLRRAKTAALGAGCLAAGALAASWLGLATRYSQGPVRDGASTSPALLAGRPRQLTSAPGWEASPAVSPDGSLVAFASDESGNADIWIVGGGGATTLKLTSDPADDDKPCWYPDGRTIAFASSRGGARSVWKVPALGGSPTVLVSDAADPAIDPTGTRIAFVRAGPNAATRIAVAALTDVSNVTVLTDDDDGVWGHRDPAWSPDGRTIVYAAQRGLWRVPASGGDARALTTDDEADEEPVFSPDGRHVYFSSSREGTQALWRIAAQGGTPERVTLGSGPEAHPSFSRDGRYLAYTTFRVNPDIVLRELLSGREITHPNASSEHMPTFSPDGGAFMFVSDRQGGEYRVWQQPLSEGRPSERARVLIDHQGSYPAYSPDGRWVAYYRIGGGKRRSVWVMPTEGGVPVRLTTSTDEEFQPEWSPSGTEVAFVSESKGLSRILAVPVRDGRSTGPARAIVSVPGQYETPRWSQDGRWIAYVAADPGRGANVWVVSSAGGSAPRRVTSDNEARRVRWHPRAPLLLVSAVGEQGVSIRQVDPSSGQWRVPKPPFVMGRNNNLVDFDVSRDGRWLIFSRDAPTGDVWLIEMVGGPR